MLVFSQAGGLIAPDYAKTILTIHRNATATLEVRSATDSLTNSQQITLSGTQLIDLQSIINSLPKIDAQYGMELQGHVADAGFANTRVEPILGGLVAIHSGWKI